MIVSFLCKQTEMIFGRQRSRRFPIEIQTLVRRKLVILDAATDLQTLRSPPGNHLEALEGDRKGQYSVRVNNQWRLCFRWKDGNAHDVELVDYH